MSVYKYVVAYTWKGYEVYYMQLAPYQRHHMDAGNSAAATVKASTVLCVSYHDTGEEAHMAADLLRITDKLKGFSR